MRKTAITVLLLALTTLTWAGAGSTPDDGNTSTLAKLFIQPPMEYRPYVWWHWMGSNFSKEGIRKDLEAMKENGIAGATIFNLTSAVQESHFPVGNNPWPNQTFRSDEYWEAMRYAAEEAERLGLKLGLHNTPGYSSTGGPWIDEPRAMQIVVKTKTPVSGGQTVRVSLPKPDEPVYRDYSGRERQATYYEDIAVVAVPAGQEGLTAADAKDLTALMSADGQLTWEAPAGNWLVYRIGHAPFMSTPHPLPDELIGHALEADKMSVEVSNYHWDCVLNPLKEHLGQYFGKSFTHILVDSYEAGSHNWTNGYREQFEQINGYDPVPMMAISDAEPENPLSKQFAKDTKAAISRLFIENGWKVARDRIKAEGLLMAWEPYGFGNVFDTYESIGIPDILMNEYWTHGSGRINAKFIDKAKEVGKNIIAAEAFTGHPQHSRYTEDPAYLKHTADGTFVSGVNMLFLHHWVHQPFDDRYQPGMGMGWWGTHFGRNQTWFRQGKAFMTYLSRCQMMLRQGTLEEHAGNQLHRRLENADIYFIVNQGKEASTEEITCTRSATEPELWDPYTGSITLARQHNGVTTDGLTRVAVTLQPGQSTFVVFNHQSVRYKKQPAYRTASQSARPVGDVWSVDFEPKVDTPFRISDFQLSDFSKSDDVRLKYFSGTATYTRNVTIDKQDLAKDKRIAISLGELNDIAELWVNGKAVGTLWYPPYEADITPFLHKGTNTITVAVTNNWANRMIGDEQYEPDFEWGYDRGEERGHGLKDIPDWVVKNEPRPSKDRKTFFIWTYFRKDSPLQPAGLVGPVELKVQTVAPQR